MVYRPMGISKRTIKQRKSVRDRTTNYTIRRRKYVQNRCKDTFDNINYRIFFSENNWDYNKDRNLHKDVKITKPGRFMKKKWLPDTDTQTKGMIERKKKKFVTYLADLLFKLLIDDLIETGNRVLFTVDKHFHQVEGNYKLGVYKDNGIITNFEQLILSIVPGSIERVTYYYPVILLEGEMLRKLKKAYSLKNKEYESIDVQERIAAHNRLSGLYRCVRQPSKNKKAHI